MSPSLWPHQDDLLVALLEPGFGPIVDSNIVGVLWLEIVSEPNTKTASEDNEYSADIQMLRRTHVSRLSIVVVFHIRVAITSSSDGADIWIEMVSCTVKEFLEV